jgi:thioredoxin reductase (NADPH)
VTAHQKIDIRFNTAVTEILGESKVTGLRTRKSSEGAVVDLEVDAIFAYVGLEPNTAVLQDRLSLDRAGRIPTDGWMRSELAGVCAAGTVRCQSPCRAVSAAGDGASAAVTVDRYLTEGSWREG